jgi:hypothetical protein
VATALAVVLAVLWLFLLGSLLLRLFELAAFFGSSS